MWTSVIILPYELLFGRPTGDNLTLGIFESNHESLIQYHDDLYKMRELVELKMTKTDEESEPERFESLVGRFIYVKKHKYDKFEVPYEGPYEVTKHYRSNLVELKKPDGQVFKTNLRRCKIHLD